MAMKSYDLSYKVTRIHISDYLLLKELSKRLGIPMAEALHLAITEQAKREQVTVIPRTQLRMMPIIIPTIAVNGSKVAAFASKLKGVRYE